MSKEIVLLVDDDSVALRRVGRALEAAGFHVQVACAHQEAVSYALARPFASAVISLDMSNGAGFDIAHLFAVVAPHTPCLLLTSKADLSTLSRLYDNGNIYNHLPAPLEDVGDLVRQIGKALEHRTLRRQNAYLLAELRDTRDALRAQMEFHAQIEKMASMGVIADHLYQELLQPLTSFAHYCAYLRGKLESAILSDDRMTLSLMDNSLREMQEAAKQCREIVRNACSFSQETAIEKRLTNLHEVLYDALLLLRHTMEARGIVLKLQLAEDLPEITAHPALLRQALVHLLINAIQAMPEGGEIGVETRVQSGVRLTLRDTGCGIAPEAMPFIFQPFFTTRPHGKGTGLGLSVAHAILQQHEAQIEIESQQSRGTTVVIRLPAAKVVSSETVIVSQAA
jgi:signal transduction histidine kinase